MCVSFFVKINLQNKLNYTEEQIEFEVLSEIIMTETLWNRRLRMILVCF